MTEINQPVFAFLHIGTVPAFHHHKRLGPTLIPMATVLSDCLRIQDVPLPSKLEEELSQPPLREIVTKKSKGDV